MPTPNQETAIPSPTEPAGKAPAKAGLGLRAKLVIATLLLCSCFAAGTFWCAQQAAKNAARVRFSQVSDATFKRMQEATQSRIDLLNQGVAAAVLDPVFRAQLSRLRQSDAAFGLGEPSTQELPVAEVHGVLSSAELPYFKNYAFFVIASADKVLLLNRAQGAAHGTPVALPLLEQTEQQPTVSSFIPGSAAELKALGADPKQLYLMIAKKIDVAGQKLGYIVVGESVTDGLLKDLDRVSQAHSGIAVGGKLWSRDATAANVAENFLKQPQAAGRTDFTLAGEEYFVQSAPSGLVLVKPISADLALLTSELKLQFVVYLAPLSLLALLAALGYAQFFAAPIVGLTGEVNKVKAGNYAAKMPVSRNDEVGELARAFNDMTESLSALRIDPLTGLYSEQYLKDTLAFELVYSATHKRPLALVNIRIAQFEEVITRLGEDGAREQLQIFAEHFAGKHKRTKDVAARGDEDEFWLLLIDTDLPQARLCCQAILNDQAPQMPPVNLGLAVFNAHIGDADGFIDAARMARADAERMGPRQMALAQGVALG